MRRVVQSNSHSSADIPFCRLIAAHSANHSAVAIIKTESLIMIDDEIGKQLQLLAQIAADHRVGDAKQLFEIALSRSDSCAALANVAVDSASMINSIVLEVAPPNSIVVTYVHSLKPSKAALMTLTGSPLPDTGALHVVAKKLCMELMAIGDSNISIDAFLIGQSVMQPTKTIHDLLSNLGTELQTNLRILKIALFEATQPNLP